MHPFPHKYDVAAHATPDDHVVVESARLPSLQSAPPLEFGGPGDRWSPETLLVAAVADCFILTFRAIASFSRLSWVSIGCEVSGTVDRVDRVTQFTAFEVRARLRVPAGADVEQAHRLLIKAEQTCLVAQSLKAAAHLDAIVETDAATP
jgi:organic hydroperoxide reductase OsmC/OhrA